MFKLDLLVIRSYSTLVGFNNKNKDVRITIKKVRKNDFLAVKITKANIKNVIEYLFR